LERDIQWEFLEGDIQWEFLECDLERDMQWEFLEGDIQWEFLDCDLEWDMQWEFLERDLWEFLERDMNLRMANSDLPVFLALAFQDSEANRGKPPRRKSGVSKRPRANRWYLEIEASLERRQELVALAPQA